MRIWLQICVVLPMLAGVVCAEPTATNQPAGALITVPVVKPGTNAAPVAAVKKKEKFEEDFDRGVECLSNTNFSGAAQAFESVLVVKTNNAEAMCNLALAYVQLGQQGITAQQQLERWQKAADLFGKAAQIRTDDKMVYLYWADTLMLIGDMPIDGKWRLACYQGAAEKCRKATEIAPQDWEGYHKLAVLTATKLPDFAVNDQVRLTLYKEGAALFGKALEQTRFSGEAAPAYANWGSALLRAAILTNDPTQKEALLREAKDKYEKSAKKVGTLARTWTFWGKTCLDLARLTRSRVDFREAVDRLNTSLSIDDKDPSVHYSLACAYMQLDHSLSALEALKKCFELDTSKTYVMSAQKDPDFTALRGQESFETLLDTYLKRGAPAFNPQLRSTPTDR